MANGIYHNTHDWSKDLQPHIDKLYSLDGNPDSLSEEDIQIAQDSYCKDSYNNNSAGKEVSSIVCNNRSETKLFSEKAGLLNGLRSQFSSNNPVHEHLRLDSELAGLEKMEFSYGLLGKILIHVKDCFHKNPNLTPKDKLIFIYQAMRDLKIELVKHAKPLFITSMCGKNVNCDGSSFIANAVAYEFDFPVHLVSIATYACKHVIVRWQEQDVKFNIDRGDIHPDSFYEKTCKIKKEILDGPATYLALIYNSHGLTKFEEGEYDDAIKIFNLAIDSDPKFAVAYLNRGATKAEMNRYQEAIKDYDQVIIIDPDFADAYFNRGLANEKLGEVNAAIKDYNSAVGLNQNNAEAWFNLAILYYTKIKDLGKACECIRNAHQLEPHNQEFSKLFNEIKCGTTNMLNLKDN